MTYDEHAKELIHELTGPAPQEFMVFRKLANGGFKAHLNLRRDFDSLQAALESINAVFMQLRDEQNKETQ